VLRGRDRRVLDSTILADAVATQDTITQLVAAIRRVRRLVPKSHEVDLGAHDYDRPGKPDCAWDNPEATQALVSGLVGDALAVLEAVGALELDDEQAAAIALLALVPGQTSNRIGGPGPGGSPAGSSWLEGSLGSPARSSRRSRGETEETAPPARPGEAPEGSTGQSRWPLADANPGRRQPH
jgi:hypothetical protein